MSDITLLAIESSCDETSAAVIQNGIILSNIVAGQEVHSKYGGIVPELASRAHQQHIVPVVHEALSKAKIVKNQLNAVAFTGGPGLLGSLLVGVSYAKAFAKGLNVPILRVNHMQAHILAHFIDDPKPAFPFLCLTVSGGHTQIVLVKGFLDMQVIGETQDDAVGEAFDKAAKMLGLPYPGGPLIDKHAAQGNALAYEFPNIDTPGLTYSFSGIKTSFLYFIQKQTKLNPDFVAQHLPDLCASIQHTLIRILFTKLRRAVKETGIHRIAIAGGVSANSGLRKTLAEEAEKHRWEVFIPSFEYCTDNAAMIAMAGHYMYQQGLFEDWSFSPEPRLKL
ncbi:MAG TPA: tRNA (adenosine(37)-N6)-threonylcarbamoyltransferase complex transferase subunit TsaD [Cytophagaceae bacterium]|jgi:N6-L-threonylcarbamoyladenine synthase|nr:tRNA (adenosine(37)-N6)-threonylcarbamoyltransferase complex transferase subunit TsaD [Cytophagaceae bacterium]